MAERNRPGLWWFSGTGEHVGHESWLERDRLMALDADAAEPMWLHPTTESGRPAGAPRAITHLAAAGR